MEALIVGCGYLGKRIAALWLAQGWRVFATTRGRAEDEPDQWTEEPGPGSGAAERRAGGGARPGRA